MENLTHLVSRMSLHEGEENQPSNHHMLEVPLEAAEVGKDVDNKEIKEEKTFLTILGVTEMLCSFRLVLERKTGKEIPVSSRLELFEKFSANNFAVSDAEDNTSRLLNRGDIADLPLLRTLLVMRQKFLEPRFWEVMDSLDLLRLVASRILLQRLLACLNFTLNSEDLSFWYKQKK